MQDAEIIELLFARSGQALAELATKHGAVCRRVAENILGDARDVEECVNDAYLGVWNTVPPQRPSPLRTYLCRIVRNLATARKSAAASTTRRLTSWSLALPRPTRRRRRWTRGS